MAFYNFNADGSSTRTGTFGAAANLAASATTANNVHAIINGTPSAIDVDWNLSSTDGVRFWRLPSPANGGTVTAHHASDHGASSVYADFEGLDGGARLTGTLQAGATLLFAFNNSGNAVTAVLGSDDLFTARHGTVAAQGGDVFIERVDA